MEEKTYTVKEIEEMLQFPCCHVYGTHDPEHYEKGKYVCTLQVEKAFRNLCKQLKINPKVKHRDKCGWCKDYPKYTKGDGKGFWDKPNECVNCGNGKYTHDPESYKEYCKDFVPCSFEAIKQDAKGDK